MSLKQKDFFLNMYSKAGKSSSQIYAHLIGRTSKSYSIQKICNPQFITITPNKLTKKSLKQQPFSQGLSREYLNKLQNKGNTNQSICIYNPKYSAIQKKSDLGGKFVVEHKITIKQENDSYTSIDLSNIKSKRTKGYVDLKRQLSRQQYYRQQNNSKNSKLNQFLSINTNSIREQNQYSIKFKRSRSVEIKGSRNSLNKKQIKCFQSFYDSENEERKIKLFSANFEKQGVRNSLMSKSVGLRDQSIYQYDQFSNTNTNTNSIIRPITTKKINIFKKLLQKTYRDQQSMPNTNKRRFQIKAVNQKLLEFNSLTK
ncbi:unnamed protein product [Paramecium primaurelia]|uniref:Uncharacterized protein n=1 Tax=Paramecium primaurelia TaxID=5886 RepID=A0A8S1NTJ3_PARPR|nr:unnamed protein product [Paramecium primaurelia]